jgi:hypothetical protein
MTAAPRLRCGSGLLDPVAVSASFTIGPVNHEQVIQNISASDITLTLPNDMPPGFAFIVDQADTGLIIFAAATGASIVNRQDFDRTAGQDAMMSVYVRSNVDGRSAVYVLSGDGATA